MGAKTDGAWIHHSTVDKCHGTVSSLYHHPFVRLRLLLNYEQHYSLGSGCFFVRLSCGALALRSCMVVVYSNIAPFGLWGVQQLRAISLWSGEKARSSCLACRIVFSASQIIQESLCWPEPNVFLGCFACLTACADCAYVWYNLLSRFVLDGR